MTCQIAECERKAHCRGWCNKHYQRWYKYGDPLKTKFVAPESSLEDRLRHYGWTITDAGCWEWNASRTKPGYGRIVWQGKTLSAHRAAYTVWIGAIPDGELVRHKCDNPPCINPEHLETGTHQDNMDDRTLRGRTNPRRGEKHTSAKLTADDVRQIRILYAEGANQRGLAARFGTTNTNISLIVTGQTWKHVILDEGTVDTESLDEVG